MSYSAIEQQLTEDFVRESVNTYVKRQFEGFNHIKTDNPKAIHDSVHGTDVFAPYEIAFLDLPIVQRLRRISQTDVSSFVFPAGNHNRFEHTVGTAIVAGKMIDSVFSKNNALLSNTEKSVVYHNCRVAAILHDCGHGPFSHLSEQLFSSQFTDIKQKNRKFKGASAHEILSYYIATSDSMRSFNSETIKGVYGIDVDLDFVGEIIVGFIDKKDYGYAVEIINGAFDADKLDYILRDAHATGIRMALDLPRLLYTLNVISDKENVNRLAIDISGVAALEAIVFNKMMLTSTIYHHQKVRAAGCMLKDIIEYSGAFKSAIDYLYYTDDKVHNMSLTDQVASRHLQMIKNRALPKRAFCFSTRTLDDVTALRKIMQTFENQDLKKEVIAHIALYLKEELGHFVQEREIWIDSPSNPKFKEATHCLIKSDGSEDNYIQLCTVFPTDDWVRAFSENKWQGFVYAMPENCRHVAAASKHVFEEVFQTKFNSFASKLCKIDDT